MVSIEIFIFDRNGSLLEIIAQLISLDHQFVVSSSFIFPEQHIIAVIVFRNGSLDTLGDLAGTDLVEIFTEIRKQPTYEQYHQYDTHTKDFERHEPAAFRKPVFKHTFWMEAIEKSLDRMFR